MALNLDDDIVATEDVDKKLRAICGIPGSARASRAVAGALAGNSSSGSPFGGAPNGAREGACAPQQSDESVRKFAAAHSTELHIRPFSLRRCACVSSSHKFL